MRIRPGIELAGLSDVGCVRDNNEDQYSYWEPTPDEDFERKGRLAMVADGMGGHEGGQEASRIAVETIERVYADTPGNNIQDALLNAFASAHQSILLYAREHPSLLGMGTTTTAIVILGDALYYAHVGDSRLYLLRAGEISRVTRDHSYVGRLMDEGLIDEKEAAHHPHRNVLLKALGSGSDIAPDSPDNPIILKKGDVLLLCTDGLWGVVSDSEMRDTVASKTVQEACEILIAKARALGGPDNITVEIIQV